MDQKNGARAAHADQPARDANVAAFVEYFQNGCKPKTSTLGVEIEHFLVDNTGQPLTYSQPNGVADVLRTLSARYPDVSMHGDDILGVAKPHMNVTIEPAAQLEISAGPFESIADMRFALGEFERDVAAALTPVAGRMVALGYDPMLVAADKELIPKARYDIMNRYLSAISPSGPRMMRGSASTQVSIDYTSEEDAAAKMRVASALAPLLSLMCDNAPVFEGTRAPHRLMRAEIWRYLDPDRCNTVPGCLEAGFSFADYANYILDVPAVVALDAEGEARYDTRTFGDIFADRTMTHADIEHALSMVWPDARLKTYVEIRPADALPIYLACAYEALIKGIFYGPALGALAAAFEGVDAQDVDDAKTAIMERGYEAETFSRNAGDMCDALVEMAYEGLPAGERGFLDPLARLVKQRITPADVSEFA